MNDAKAAAWGAGFMGITGLAGVLLGPSPLLLPLAPLVAIAYVPFMLATAALGTPMGLAELGLADLAVGGKAGFVVWSALLGAGAGRIIAVWRTKRHKRRGSSRCGP